jgi:hypothetical protein
MRDGSISEELLRASLNTVPLHYHFRHAAKTARFFCLSEQLVVAAQGLVEFCLTSSIFEQLLDLNLAAQVIVRRPWSGSLQVYKGDAIASLE